MKKLADECKNPQEYWFKNWAKVNKNAVDLQERIDRAIEYIENYFIKDSFTTIQLLAILKGKSE